MPLHIEITGDCSPKEWRALAALTAVMLGETSTLAVASAAVPEWLPGSLRDLAPVDPIMPEQLAKAGNVPPPPTATATVPIVLPDAATTATPATVAAETPATPEVKAEEPAKPDPKAFDAKALVLPEGAQLDEATMGKFSELAKETGLSQEAAQKLFDLHQETIKAATEQSTRLWSETQTQWVNEVKADKDIGGDKLPGVQQVIGKILDNPEFAATGVKEAFNLTGAGNNPAILKTFYNMAKALTEGQHVAGNPARNMPASAADAIYPHLKQG